MQHNLFFIFVPMRNLILAIIGLFATELAFGQGLPLTRNEGENVPNDTAAVASTDKPVESVIKVWTLSNQFSEQKFTNVDTATIGFNNYNPIFRKSISNTYLGFLGSSYEANHYFDRTNESNFYFLRNFDAYRQTQNKVKYYNTTTPYASLTYEQGSQGGSSKEQIFKAFFSQNMDSITNFGFQFNAIKVPGQYSLQKSNHKFLNVFASRNGKRLNSYVSIINGSDGISENGGIADTTVNRFTTVGIKRTNIVFPIRQDPGNFLVNLLKVVENSSKSVSIFTSQEYLMGQIPFLERKIVTDSTLNDSLNVFVPEEKFTPKYSIQYSAEFENHKRFVDESVVDERFFANTFIDNESYTDSSSFTRFSQILQVKAFESENRKFTFGKRAFIENEIVSARHPLPGGQRSYNYSNIYVGGELYRRNSSFVNWNATARFAMLGRNIGDALVKGTAEKTFIFGADTTLLSVAGWYQDQTADIFQEHWFGNHYKWENSFKKQHEVLVKGEYAYPRFQAKAGINYALLANYIYNNEQAMPDQYEAQFSIISASLDKTFTLGRFGWSNKVIWQELSNDAVLHLPVWNLYSSIYYSHYLFKVMKLQLGAEVYYNSKFKADSYEPSTTQFYLQNDVTTGGYPVINLFVNAKLSRTSAFAELYHANSMLKMGEFFTSPHYPLDQMAFRFGFLWTFYD